MARKVHPACSGTCSSVGSDVLDGRKILTKIVQLDLRVQFRHVGEQPLGVLVLRD